MRVNNFMNFCFCVFCVCTLSSVAQSAKKQSEMINPVRENILLLKSIDKNERRLAIDGLYNELTHHLEPAKGLDIRNDLMEYIQKWDEHSYKAALLLGKIGDKRALPILKAVLTESQQITGIMDDRYIIAPQMQLACLKALLLLRDRAAYQEVKDLLNADDVETRGKGIDCILYAKRQDMIPDLLPLLDDKRDAINISPSGGAYYLRICDLALNAIFDIINVSISFEVQYGKKYSDRQISEMRSMVLKLEKSKNGVSD